METIKHLYKFRYDALINGKYVEGYLYKNNNPKDTTFKSLKNNIVIKNYKE